MNETTTIFTFTQFALIALFAALTIAGIIFGSRLKRRRLEAEAEVEENREAIEEAREAHPAAAQPKPETPAASTEAKRETLVAPPPPAPVVPVVPEPQAEAAVPAPVAEPAPTPPTAADPVPVPAQKPAAPAADRVSPVPPIAPTAGGLAGDITQLKGLGPKLAATLAELGITRVDQIAAMSEGDLAELDAKLGAFKGRPARDRWVEQARLLVAGDKAAYEAEFGKLG